MKNTLLTLLMLALIVFAGCSGSDVYKGEWKGTDSNGDRYTFFFKPKTFSVTKADGESLNFEYTQNSVKIKNSVKSYGILLEDGRVYNILFPIAKDDSKCIMTMEDGKPVYALSRTSYLSLEDVYKLAK